MKEMTYNVSSEMIMKFNQHKKEIITDIISRSAQYVPILGHTQYLNSLSHHDETHVLRI
jgi:hypothetical protein